MTETGVGGSTAPAQSQVLIVAAPASLRTTAMPSAAAPRVRLQMSLAIVAHRSSPSTESSSSRGLDRRSNSIQGQSATRTLRKERFMRKT